MRMLALYEQRVEPARLGHLVRNGPRGAGEAQESPDH